jgi:hypothetical protein
MSTVNQIGCLIWVVLIIAGVGYCSFKGAGSSGDDEELAAYTALASAQTAVKARLKDPGSAEFSSMTVYGQEPSFTVCGLVNAKNGFGGMAGPTPVVVLSGGTVYLGGDDDDAVVTRMYDTFCLGTTALHRP